MARRLAVDDSAACVALSRARRREDPALLEDLADVALDAPDLATFTTLLPPAE